MMRLSVAQVLAGVLTLLVVASVALAGVLGYRYLDARWTEQARDSSLDAARSYATTMFGYDPGNVEAHVNSSKSVVTGAAKSQYDKLITNPVQGQNIDFIEGVKKQQVVSQAVIQDAGVVTNTRDSSTVLIFMNQSVSRGGKDLVRVDPSRLTFAMVKQDGRWMIQNIDVITDDSFRSRIQQVSTPPPGAVPLPGPSDTSTSAPAPDSAAPDSSAPQTSAPAPSVVPTP
ncbi:hypothetical protein [Gordonia polyisoprenivorans]|uniref:hypothetical protein n=1 Tax=Gordonia polyisoprenivorans TaxID=84595 RepID=UPI001AD6D1BA|nr:hypothetical protein [Gordonia polyisoprenivorans]QTI68748.1 hypothetical protein J6U32_25360 [Gordonia polyisoprenivorans]